jgi:hypothetical protein
MGPHGIQGANNEEVLKALIIGMALCSPFAHAATKDAGAGQGAPKSQAQPPAEFDRNLAQLQRQFGDF